MGIAAHESTASMRNCCASGLPADRARTPSSVSFTMRAHSELKETQSKQRAD